MSKLVNIAIVLATIALAAAPVINDQLRIEVARWYLAAATNRVADGLEIQTQLAGAEAWGGDVSGLRDYWLLRAEQALASSPSEVAAVIASAVARDKSNFDIGYRFAQRLAQHAYFSEAVAVLEAALVGELRQIPVMLNELAYFRALAAIDLDRALDDVDQALADSPNAPDLRDTRAWVLFQMGKPQQAIEDVDFAVQAFDNMGPAGLMEETMGWLEQRLVRPPDPRSADDTLTRREAGDLLWGRGVVHYHRAKILEALGRAEESQKEFDWLLQHKLPADDRLY